MSQSKNAPVAPVTAAGPSGARPRGRTVQDRERSHRVPAGPLPMVRGWPLVGSLPDIQSGGMLDFIDRQWRKNGDAFGFKLPGHGRMVVVAHPDAIERVLASHRERFIKGRTYDSLRTILGDGMLSLPTGPAWRAQRSIMQPTFHRAGLEGLVAEMVMSATTYMDQLRRRLPQGGPLDIHREMTKLTLDVVIKALFGPGLIDAAEIKYETLMATLELVTERANGASLPLFIPTPSNRRFKRVLGELNEIIGRILTRARTRRARSSSGTSTTLLDMLLDAVDQDTGQPLSNKLIRDELLTLFVAGHETTALTLTWLFYLLKGPGEIWTKLRAEEASVLGGRVATFNDLPNLKYHRAVIDEVLRLSGPVALVARNVTEDDNLLGFRIQPGDCVLPYFRGAQRHPDYWERPEAFWPERFLAENSAGRDRWAYTPFSSGPRVCIGNTFSLHETVLILSLIVQQADVSLVAGQTIRPVMLATVRPSSPVMVQWGWRHRTA